MSLQCKAYLLPEGAKEPSEIRSFRLDEGVASNYDYLKRKIATVFPNLGWNEDGSAFKLAWKDSDGDFITFSSDEELVDALGEIAKDGVFRVYIRQMSGKKDEFPWQSYVNDLWKSLNSDIPSGRPGCAGFSHPYARRGGFGGRRGCGPKAGCGARMGCGPKRSRFPAGFFVDAYPSFFPGFHAEFWGFDDDDEVRGPGCCRRKKKSEKKSPSNMDTSDPQNVDKPSTSSST